MSKREPAGARPTKTKLAAVRLEVEVITRVDALRPSLSTAGHEATRSDALRALVLVGLKQLEQKAPRKPGKQEPK